MDQALIAPGMSNANLYIRQSSVASTLVENGVARDEERNTVAGGATAPSVTTRLLVKHVASRLTSLLYRPPGPVYQGRPSVHPTTKTKNKSKRSQMYVILVSTILDPCRRSVTLVGSALMGIDFLVPNTMYLGIRYLVGMLAPAETFAWRNSFAMHSAASLAADAVVAAVHYLEGIRAKMASGGGKVAFQFMCVLLASTT